MHIPVIVTSHAGLNGLIALGSRCWWDVGERAPPMWVHMDGDQGARVRHTE